ncbi:cyclic peptide export ABC transporter [Salinarimonas sp.]|uniref:cyclic peptide export ABC transporter n=1 Tax=Salinarimonas sp. TaxID=2766526 RepID=UPI0032D8C794
MNVVNLLARICGPLLVPATALVMLGAAATVFALQLIGEALSSDEVSLSSTGLWFAAACVVLIAARIASRSLLDWLAMRAISRIRHNLARNLLQLPLERIEALGAPKIMALIFDDIVRIGAGLSGLPTMFGNVIVLAGAFVYLGFVSVKGLLALLVVLGIGIAIYRWLLARAAVVQRRGREVRDDLYDVAGGMVRGVKELTLNRRRKHFIFEEVFETLLRRHFRYSFIGALYSTSGLTLSQVLYFLCLGVVVFLVPVFVEMDREVLTKFAVVVLYLPAPIEGIVLFISTLTMAQVSIERLNQLDVLGEDLHRKRDFPMVARHGPVHMLGLRDVVYAYGGDEGATGFEAGPVSLELTPGEVVFFVGGNGSGKTTVAKVLSGLYRPAKGSMVLNGAPVADGDLVWYSQHFAAVFNDFHVFDKYRRTEDDDGRDAAEIDDLLRRLQIERAVRFENGAISTVTALSTGQRKRLALLVALLEDKPVYIFDEWAADQDPAFRDVFYRQILPELATRGKVVIAITHDDDYFHTADRIVTFRYGAIESDVSRRDVAADVAP